MNTQSNWNEMRSKIKSKWGKISDRDVDSLNGHMDQLSSKIQKAYGYSKSQAERESEDFQSTCGTRAGDDKSFRDDKSLKGDKAFKKRGMDSGASSYDRRAADNKADDAKSFEESDRGMSERDENDDTDDTKSFDSGADAPNVPGQKKDDKGDRNRSKTEPGGV